MCLLSLCSPAFPFQVPDLEHAIEASYANKIIMFRGFYTDDRLQFDERGVPSGSPHTGSWTICEMMIRDVNVSKDKVELHGPRVVMVGEQKERKLQGLQLNS